MTAPVPCDLVLQARDQARRHLASALTRRWDHTQGVAAAAAGLVGGLTPGQSAILVAAAWLHDIGYAPDLVATGFHPLDGATFAHNDGFPAAVVSLVAFHTGARFEAERRGLTLELDQFADPDPVLLDALTCADMTTSPDGVPISAQSRLADIFTRYPPGTPVADAVHASAPQLLAAVARCRQRIVDAAPS